MTDFKIITHKEGRGYSNSHFFILNKGLNSGKPLKTPCPNCFVCIVHNQHHLEQLFWLAFALWKSTLLKKELKGSVIPFIRINDYKKAYIGIVTPILNTNIDLNEVINLFQQLDDQQELLSRKLFKLEQIKSLLFQKLITSSIKE